MTSFDAVCFITTSAGIYANWQLIGNKGSFETNKMVCYLIELKDGFYQVQIDGEICGSDAGGGGFRTLCNVCYSPHVSAPIKHLS